MDANGLTIGVPSEVMPSERRVALTPIAVQSLTGSGSKVIVQADAGAAAGFTDAAYEAAGATVAHDRADVFTADVIAQVRTYPASRGAAEHDLDLYRSGQIVVGLADPLFEPEACNRLAERGVRLFALELLPRITRAQSMDALSSQATVAGYKAVLVAAERLPKMFPMLTTAAGTVAPARALVVGAGVAGLQAIATARRLGAVVVAYDVRPAAQDDVESLGARLIQLPLGPDDAQDAQGYAKELGETFYRRQQELLAQAVAGIDVIVCTAMIPGKSAPVLLTKEAVAAMAPGSVIVDLAAERGGNCELTRADEIVESGGVTILGPTNLAATVPHQASLMFAKNQTAFIAHIAAEGQAVVDPEDEIVRSTLVCDGGKIVNPKVQQLLSTGEPT